MINEVEWYVETDPLMLLVPANAKQQSPEDFLFVRNCHPTITSIAF
jgi:hypothetical protein